jgi:hypothetical protein
MKLVNDESRVDVLEVPLMLTPVDAWTKSGSAGVVPLQSVIGQCRMDFLESW